MYIIYWQILERAERGQRASSNRKEIEKSIEFPITFSYHSFSHCPGHFAISPFFLSLSWSLRYLFSHCPGHYAISLNALVVRFISLLTLSLAYFSHCVLLTLLCLFSNDHSAISLYWHGHFNRISYHFSIFRSFSCCPAHFAISLTGHGHWSLSLTALVTPLFLLWPCHSPISLTMSWFLWLTCGHFAISLTDMVTPLFLSLA